MTHYLSIGSVIKGERKWLREWIDWHKMIGVEHFFLMCNDPLPVYLDLQAEFFSEPITWHFLPDSQRVQYDGLRLLFDTYSTQSYWLALIDPDEFIFINDPNKNKPDLQKFLTEFDEPWIASLSLHWLVFGSSNMIYSPDKVLPVFTRRALSDHYVNLSIKQILKTSLTTEIAGSHYAIYKPDKFPVNEKKQILPYFSAPHNSLGVPAKAWKPQKASHEKIWLNHYCTKSRNDWLSKQQKGYVDKSANVNWVRYWKEMDRNEVEDIRPSLVSISYPSYNCKD